MVGAQVGLLSSSSQSKRRCHLPERETTYLSTAEKYHIGDIVFFWIGS